MSGIIKTMSPRTRFIVRQLGIYILICLVILTGAIVISRRSFAKAEERPLGMEYMKTMLERMG